MLKNSKSPAINFNTKAAEIKSSRNIGWPEAYSATMKEHPELLDAMDDDDPLKKILCEGILKNKKRYARRFSDMVLNRQTATGCKFMEAFNFVKETEPGLFTLMSGE